MVSVLSERAAPSAAAGLTAAPLFTLWPPRGRKGLNPDRPGEFAARLAAFRCRHAALPDARLVGTLHLLDLSQIRLRFGRRWPELREKVFQIVEHTLDRAIGPDDLYVVADESTIVVLASGRRRSDAKAHIELVAGDLTGRLCGLVPGGVAIRVRTLPFDLVRGLEGVGNLAMLRIRIAECERDVENAERAAFAAVRERLLIAFEPLLHPRKRLVAGHRLEACWRDPEGRLRTADDLIDERVAGVFDALVDLWLLEGCARELVVPGRRQTTLVLPLRAETLLARASRRAYLDLCRKLPSCSSRHLVFELTELSGAMPQARLREVVGYVAPFALAVAVRLYPPLLSLDHLEGCGIRFVSLGDASPGPRSPPISLAHFAALAHEAGMRAVLLGVQSEERLAAALAARVDYVAGPAIAPLRLSPLSRRRLSP